MSKRQRERAARTAIFRQLAEQLARDHAGHTLAEKAVAERLIAEFTRRGKLDPPGPPPGVIPLPGICTCAGGVQYLDMHEPHCGREPAGA